VLVLVLVRVLGHAHAHEYGYEHERARARARARARVNLGVLVLLATWYRKRMWRAVWVCTLGMSVGIGFGCGGKPRDTAPAAETAAPKVADKPAPDKPATPQAPADAPAPPTPPGATSKPAPSAPPAANTEPEDPVKRGAALYANMCAVCHGERGEGYKADQAPMLANPDFLLTVTDQFLFVAIIRGRPGTTMSAWGAEMGGPLAPNDVSALVAFMRSWEPQHKIKLDESSALGNVMHGATIFGKECAECHGTKGKFLRLLNPELLEFASPGFLRHAIRKGRPPTTMPAFEAKLGAKGVEDVVAYLKNIALEARPASARAPAVPPPLPLGPVPLNPKGPAPVGFITYPGMTSVAVVEREYKRNARMAILDARAPTDYAHEHIAGAVSVPFYDPSPYLAKLPKKAWLVCYCGCPHAESGTLAMKLKAAGFENVTVLDEGLWEWKDKGYPMREGPKP
jgi:mono/diheme cytochrome c family protein/rhodanese-related sulfurtransferase